MRDNELELEAEFEFETFGEGEGLFENEWESLGEGPLGEGPLGEGPLGEFEFEGALGEGPLGEGPLGEGPLGELEFEGEAFSFGNIFKGVASFVKKAAPVLKKVAQAAAPIVGTAIGGPIGAKIGNAAASLIGGQRWQDVLGGMLKESEYESEAEMEAVMSGPLTEQQALGELMAAAASKAATDMEAEEQIGSAAIISLSPEDRDALRAVLPSLNRGVAVLTRILRRRPATAPAVRVVPLIVKRTAVTLRNRANAGQPVTKNGAARAMAVQTHKVLSSPAICSKAMSRNVNATRAIGNKIRASHQHRAYSF